MPSSRRPRPSALNEVGVLVPLYDFYPSIESFLDTTVKKTIDQAETNASLEPFDIKLLQVLFLIRYVDEMKGNVDNLVTLCLDQIDGDRLALRRRIEESLGRLEKETLISRSGDIYFFLTNEERDINRGDQAGRSRQRRGSQAAGRDHLRRRAQDQVEAPLQRQQDGLRLHRHVRHASHRQTCGRATCSSRSSRRWPTTTRFQRQASASWRALNESGQVLIRLRDNEDLGRELRTYAKTEKYLQTKNDGSLPEPTKRILRDNAEDNRQRRERLTHPRRRRCSSRPITSWPGSRSS